MKTLKEVLQEVNPDLTDPNLEDADLRIVGIVQRAKQDFDDGLIKSKFRDLNDFLRKAPSLFRLNINNRDEAGVLSALAVSLGLMDASEAFGDPESYQAVLTLWNQL